MRFITWAGLILAVVIVIVALYLRSHPYNLIAIGEPVRQDDFLYTVTNVEKHREVDAVSYVVTVRVDNQAKIVDYRWSYDMVYVTDSAGRRYRAIESAGFGGSDRAAVAAGSSAAYQITFDLPSTAEHPMLHYWNGIMMGDVFDIGAYARVAVPL